jgi:hypothetical protein
MWIAAIRPALCREEGATMSRSNRLCGSGLPMLGAFWQLGVWRAIRPRRSTVVVTVGLCLSGCVIEERSPPPPDTEIGFDASMNLGQGCGGQLTSWQVTLVDDGTTLGGGCAYHPIFRGLAPNTRYTFDIVGYSGSDVCWQGSCSVPTALGTLTYGDCSAAIDHSCGF